jgi:hypothetical protein
LRLITKTHLNTGTFFVVEDNGGCWDFQEGLKRSGVGGLGFKCFNGERVFKFVLKGK